MADITITEGDTLEVDYSLENTGDGTGTFDPRLLVEGVQEDQDTGITLDPAQTATGTLQWPTEDGDAVTDALAEAVTDDTSDSITVTVEDPIPDSGISRLTFDDGDTESGTSLDVWGDNDGTINGATTGVSGANQTYTTNEAYSFDGGGGYVDLGTTVVPDPTDDYSIALWLKTTDAGGEVIYGQRDINDGDDQLIITVDGDGFGIRDFDGSTQIAVGGSPSDGNWHHGVAIRSSNEYVIYLDGTEVARDNAGNPVVNDNDNIGRRGGSGGGDNYFEGDIDDLRVYGKALTAAEVSDLYNSGSI